MSAPRSRRLLADAARLNYLDGLSQDQIARRLSMTRSNVSRVLRAAKESGIVEVRIRDFDDRNELLEDALVAAFDLKAAAVAGAGREPGAQQAVARLGAEVFLDAVSGATTAAVSWGTTVQAVVGALPQVRLPGVDVVQLVGGLVSFDSQATAHDVVRDLAERIGARYRYLNTPAVFDSAAVLQHLLGETSVREALEAARRAEVALVGIGSPHSGSSATLVELLDLSEAERTQLWAEQPVGDVCGRYFDIDGVPIACASVRDRILAVPVDDLRGIPTRLGVARGADKGRAVLGALRGRFVNVLVCDEPLAQAVLDLERDRQGPGARSARRDTAPQRRR